MEIQDGTAKFKVRTKISKEEVQEFADKFIVREDVIQKAQFIKTDYAQVVVPYEIITGYKPFIITTSTSGYPAYFNPDYKWMNSDGTLQLYVQGVLPTDEEWQTILSSISTITIHTIFIKDE